MASFAWNTLDLPDDDYELVALYTEDDGYSVTYDSIEVSVDNVADGGGGCVAAPVLPGGAGPMDPTLPALVGFLLIYLFWGRRRPLRQATPEFGSNYLPHTGRAYVGTRPSAASVQNICRRVSELTTPHDGFLPTEVVAERLNRLLDGWANYFTLGRVPRPKPG